MSSRATPPEGYARVYWFGQTSDGSSLVGSGFVDRVALPIGFDTAPLNPSSLRLETLGDDLLRPSHILVWGIDATGAIVPLAVDSDLPDLSTDPGEGVASFPLTLVDSGTTRRRSARSMSTYR
jgi:hypothetical protein